MARANSRSPLGESIHQLILKLVPVAGGMGKAVAIVADAAGVESSTVYKWQTGRSSLPEQTLDALARLGKDTASLDRRWGEQLLTRGQHRGAGRLVAEIWGDVAPEGVEEPSGQPPLEIIEPKDGSFVTVCEPVSVVARDPRISSVEVIVRPTGERTYWVQPEAVIQGGPSAPPPGTTIWGGEAYFGEPGTRDDGKSFEIRAVGNPTAKLNEGDKLTRWPAADFSSPVVRVTRGSDVAGRRLATILFTDIVRSTEHAARLHDANWRALLDRHFSIIRDEVSRFQGRGIKKTGDGFLATFDGPAQAIDCASTIVTRVRSLDIEIRAGVHTAEIEVSSDDIIGIAVHLGARVMAEAAPSEVLVTRTVRDLIIGSGIELEPVGPHALKGFEDEWHLFRVTSA